MDGCVCVPAYNEQRGVCPGGCLPHTPWQTPPPLQRRPLKRAVRILLECILVHMYVCFCVYVIIQECVLRQQVMVFTLDICIFKNGTAKIKEKRNRRCYLWRDLYGILCRICLHPDSIWFLCDFLVVFGKVSFIFMCIKPFDLLIFTQIFYCNFSHEDSGSHVSVGQEYHTQRKRTVQKR